MKSFWSVKKEKEKKDMNWAQAKWKYPRLRPNSDKDRDGVKNQFDCRPFNKKRQHVLMKHEDSKWKKQMIEDYETVGDLKHFAEGNGRKDD